MTTSAFRTALAPVALALAVGLAGCGGGGGTTPDGGTGGSTGGGRGTGGGTGGGTDTLTIGPGFLPSSSAPVYASDTTRLGEKATEWFPPLTSVVHRAESGTTRPEAEPAEPFAIRSDGNLGFEILFQDDGEETTVGVPVSAVYDGWIEYEARDDDEELTLGLWTEETLLDENDGTKGLRDYRYLHVIGGSFYDPGEPIERFRLVFGLRTPAGGLPAGTATYDGDMSAYSWSATDSSRDARQRVRGDLNLVADFDAASLTGRIDEIRGTMPGAASSTRVSWPDTGLDIDDGKIVNGQFTATLTGYDTNDPVTPQSSLDGFAGDLVGEFYGPRGEEMGGVLTAVREAAGTADGRALEGYVLGRKALAGSDAAPLSAGVIRYDLSGSSPRVELQDADDGATALARDANGDYRLTYRMDGETRTVTMTTDDWSADWQAFVRREGRSESFLWRQRSYAYMNVVGWAGGTYPDDASTDADTYTYGFAVFGDRTAAGQMPGSGTATYSGRTEAREWQPSPGQGRAVSSNTTRYRADLSLTADFGQGTVGGQATGLERRAPGESGYTSIPGALTFDSGRIAGNSLTATVEGLGYSGSAEGAFYGPDAFEVGGVMQATHTDGRLLHGWFAGEKDD